MRPYSPFRGLAFALPAHENEVLFSKNRADGSTVVAVVASHVHVVRAEEHVPRVARVARAERTRPIVAVEARVVQVIAVATARHKEKNMVTIGAAFPFA